MSEKPRPRPPVQYGPTAATVADNVQRLRKRRELTIYDLSAKLRKVGRPISPAAVGKIERKERQVSVDDLAALAVILGVSPTALLLPLTNRADDPVTVTGGVTVDALRAWEWGIGRLPLKVHNPAKERTELDEHRLFGTPQWLPDHVGYNVKAAATGPVTLSPELARQITDLQDRYRQESGEELDPNLALRFLLGITPEGGDDGPSVD